MRGFADRGSGLRPSVMHGLPGRLAFGWMLEDQPRLGCPGPVATSSHRHADLLTISHKRPTWTSSQDDGYSVKFRVESGNGVDPDNDSIHFSVDH